MTESFESAEAEYTPIPAIDIARKDLAHYNKNARDWRIFGLITSTFGAVTGGLAVYGALKGRADTATLGSGVTLISAAVSAVEFSGSSHNSRQAAALQGVILQHDLGVEIQ